MPQSFPFLVPNIRCMVIRIFSDDGHNKFFFQSEATYAEKRRPDCFLVFHIPHFVFHISESNCALLVSSGITRDPLIYLMMLFLLVLWMFLFVSKAALGE